MKLKGVKKTVSTKNMVKETYINSMEIEFPAQQKLINDWMRIFKD